MLIALHKPYGVLSQFTPEPGSRWRTLADLNAAHLPALLPWASSRDSACGQPNPKLAGRRPNFDRKTQQQAAGAVAAFGLPAGVYALGRLDADSEGLLLLSDEPGLNSRLLDPEQGHVREYWVQVEREPDESALQKLAGGVAIGAHRSRPCGVRRIDAPALSPRHPPVRFRKNVPDCWISIELTEGKNRQVRRMTAAVGHPTLRLVRVRIGRFELGDLPPGRWRELNAAARAAVLR